MSLSMHCCPAISNYKHSDRNIRPSILNGIACGKKVTTILGNGKQQHISISKSRSNQPLLPISATAAAAAESGMGMAASVLHKYK